MKYRLQSMYNHNHMVERAASVESPSIAYSLYLVLCGRSRVCGGGGDIDQTYLNVVITNNW